MATAYHQDSPPSFLQCHSPILNLSPNMSPESQANSTSPVFDLLESTRSRSVQELYGSLTHITQDLVSLVQEEEAKTEPPAKKKRKSVSDGAGASATSRHPTRPRSLRRSRAPSHQGASAHSRTDYNANVLSARTQNVRVAPELTPESMVRSRVPDLSSQARSMQEHALLYHRATAAQQHGTRTSVAPQNRVVLEEQSQTAARIHHQHPRHLPLYPLMAYPPRQPVPPMPAHLASQPTVAQQHIPVNAEASSGSSLRPPPPLPHHSSFFNHPQLTQASQYLQNAASLRQGRPPHCPALAHSQQSSHPVLYEQLSNSVRAQMGAIDNPSSSAHHHPYARHMRHGLPGRPMIPRHSYPVSPSHMAGGQAYPNFLIHLWAMLGNQGAGGPYRMDMQDEMTEIENYEALLNLAERLGEAKPKGLSKPEIDQLPAYRFNPEVKRDSTKDQSSCVVCMCDFEAKQMLRILPCSHEFHSKCVDKWLRSNRTCPICRSDASKGLH